MTTPGPDEVKPAGQRLAPLGLIVTTINRLPDLFVPLVAALYGAREGGFSVLPVIAVVLLVSTLFRWLAWRRRLASSC